MEIWKPFKKREKWKNSFMTVTTALSCHFEEQVLRMKNKKMNKKEKQECDPDFSIFNHVIACPISINQSLQNNDDFSYQQLQRFKKIFTSLDDCRHFA